MNEDNCVIFASPEEAKERLCRSVQQFQPLLKSSKLLVNSMPKCGTNLVKNVLLHFFGGDCRMETLTPESIENTLEYWHRNEPLLKEELLICHFPKYISTQKFIRDHGGKTILVLRSPRDEILACARHFCNPHIANDEPYYGFFSQNSIPFDDIVYYCIRGLSWCGRDLESVTTRFQNYLSWIYDADFIIVFDELRAMLLNLDSVRASAYFQKLVELAGCSLPTNWRERLVAAQEKSLSWTYAQKIHKTPWKPKYEAMLRLYCGDAVDGYASAIERLKCFPNQPETANSTHRNE